MSSENTYQKLSDAFLLKASGRDAERYLQARLTNDIQLINRENHSILTAALDPQGKTQGVFTVTRGGDEEFYLLADGGDLEEVLTGILRFKVADQVDIVHESDLAIFYLNGSHESVDDSSLSFPEPEGSSMRSSTPGRYFFVSASESEKFEEQLKSFSTELSPEVALAERIKNNRPLFPTEILPGRIFSECGLFAAISSTKGCYAGQEVIEKSIARGKPPKTLLRLSLKEGSPNVGDELFANDGSDLAGAIISTAREGDTTYLFAQIKTKYEEESLSLSTSERVFSL